MPRWKMSPTASGQHAEVTHSRYDHDVEVGSEAIA